MPINLSKLIKRLKMELGIHGLTLPIDDVDGYMIDIMETITIPTFSIYQPYYETVYLDTELLQKIPESGTIVNTTRTTYLLPDFKDRGLLSVADLQYSDNASMGYSGFGGFIGVGSTSFLPYGNTSAIQQMMLNQLNSNISGMMYPRITYDFIGPNKLIVHNQLLSNRLKFVFAFEHHRSLATIPATCLTSFHELLYYDCADALYQIAKRWDNLSTAIGNIELKLDSWAEAASKRETLLNQWDDTYHMDIPGSITYK